MNVTSLQRTKLILPPDSRRVLLRPFLTTNDRRAADLCMQVMALTKGEIHAIWGRCEAEFGAA
jgi:hypothetical protein